MALMSRSNLRLSLSLQLFLCLILPNAYAVSSGQSEGFVINGRVKISNTGTRGYGLPAKTSNVKVMLNGGQRVTFLRPDGYFSFHNVSAGTHLIEVAALGYFFSPVRVDISARNPGKVQAALTETRRGLSELALEPLREEDYHEKREPFSIMSVVKSPMGLMVGFMVIVVFLMPKLMGKVPLTLEFVECDSALRISTSFDKLSHVFLVFSYTHVEESMYRIELSHFLVNFVRFVCNMKGLVRTHA